MKLPLRILKNPFLPRYYGPVKLIRPLNEDDNTAERWKIDILSKWKPCTIVKMAISSCIIIVSDVLRLEKSLIGITFHSNRVGRDEASQSVSEKEKSESAPNISGPYYYFPDKIYYKLNAYKPDIKCEI